MLFQSMHQPLFWLFMLGCPPKSDGPAWIWLVLFAPITGAARVILWLLGWSLFTPEQLYRVNYNPRTVLVFPHSSYVDFFFLLLYRAAHPCGLYHLRTLVKPQAFTYAGWFLRWIGCVPASRLEERNSGSVNRIVEELKLSPRTILALSPKGTIYRREWRNGYYHIAQALKAPILVGGIDYETKLTYMGLPLDSSLPEPEIRAQLFKELSQLVPLYPEHEVMPIRPHGPHRRTCRFIF